MTSNPTQFAPGDRFQVRPLGDRYDNVTGTIREVFGDTFGRELHAHTRHDDGTLTMWQLSRLVRIERELPDLPQRIRGATLTPGYVDVGTEEPTGALTGEPGAVSDDEAHTAPRTQQEHNEVEKTMSTNATIPAENLRALRQALSDAGVDVPEDPNEVDAAHMVMGKHRGVDVLGILGW